MNFWLLSSKNKLSENLFDLLYLINPQAVFLFICLTHLIFICLFLLPLSHPSFLYQCIAGVSWWLIGISCMLVHVPVCLYRHSGSCFLGFPCVPASWQGIWLNRPLRLPTWPILHWFQFPRMRKRQEYGKCLL